MMAVCLYESKHMVFARPADRTEAKKDCGITVRRRMTAGQFPGKKTEAGARKQAEARRTRFFGQSVVALNFPGTSGIIGLF